MPNRRKPPSLPVHGKVPEFGCVQPKARSGAVNAVKAEVKAGERGPLVHAWVGQRNILNLYNRSTVFEKLKGSRYWSAMRERMAQLYGEEMVEKMAGVFCALSPNNSEDSNWKDLETVWQAWRHGQALGKEVKVHTYAINKRKAEEILIGHYPPFILNGRKTSSMWFNIVYPDLHTDVTVDGHMVSVWQGKRLTMNQAGINGAEYLLIADGIKLAARELGMVPCALQAVLWLAHRRIHKVFYKPQMKFELEDV